MRKLTICTIACVVLALPPALHAVTFTVDSNDDEIDAAPGDGLCSTARARCTLRAAINEANARPGADTITLPAGTYPLLLRGTSEDAGFKGDLDITDDLVIHGAGAPDSRISGRRIDRVFDVHSPAHVVLSGMTIMLGQPSNDDDGGGMTNDGTATLIDVTFFRNRSGNIAGGFANLGAATLAQVRFLHNRAGSAGYAGDIGGMWNAGTARLTSVLFLANRGGEAFDNDGGWVGGMENDGDAILTDVIFRLNRAGDANGAFGEIGSGGNAGGLLNGGSVSLTRVTFDRNRAGKGLNGRETGGGGGMYNYEHGTATLHDVTFVRNRAGGCPSFTDPVIACEGGSGGGMLNEGVVTATNVTFDRNRAGNGRGAFGGDGGAIDDYGIMMLTNVTLSRNQAGNSFGSFSNGGWGGGLSTGRATLNNVTLDLNRAGRGSHGGENGEGNQIAGGDRVTLTNTIVFGSGGSCCPGCMPGSMGHNLDSGATCGLSGPGDLSNTDPQLEPQRRNVKLTNNGGFTPTMALLPGSPAIDAGDATACPATDQRGVARPQGAACDIGAYEFRVSEDRSAQLNETN